MAVYRALRDIGIGNKIIEKGDIFPGARLKQASIDILLEQDKIAVAVLPPISAIPAYRVKAKKLEKIGVMDAGQFLETDNASLALALKEPEASIKVYKDEMYKMFSIPKRRS